MTQFSLLTFPSGMTRQRGSGMGSSERSSMQQGPPSWGSASIPCVSPRCKASVRLCLSTGSCARHLLVDSRQICQRQISVSLCFSWCFILRANFANDGNFDLNFIKNIFKSVDVVIYSSAQLIYMLIKLQSCSFVACFLDSKTCRSSWKNCAGNKICVPTEGSKVPSGECR